MVAPSLAAVGLMGVSAAGMAQPLDSFGFGSRSSSLGGAVTADVEDLSASYYNPAGLARGKALRLAVGYLWAQPQLRFNGSESKVDPIRGIQLGLLVPGRLGPVRFAVGVATHVPDDLLASTVILPVEKPHWELWESRPQRTFLAMHLALRPLDWLLVGGGIAVVAGTDTALRIRGDLNMLSPKTESQLEHQVRTELPATRSPEVGLQILASETVSVGVTYRGEVQIGADLNSDANLNLTGLGKPISGELQVTTQSIPSFFPQQVVLGTSFLATRRLRVGLDVTWLDWSAHPLSGPATSAEVNVDAPKALESFLKKAAPVQENKPSSVKFADRLVPRIGLEWRTLTWSWAKLVTRTGYFFEQSPIDSQPDASNLLDNDRHVGSLGLGLMLDHLRPMIAGLVSIDAHVQFSYLPTRETTKASADDSVGDYRTGGTMIAGGTTLEVVFK